MSNEKKLSMLEELMELDEGTLTPETVLADIDEWDSVTILSLIVMVEDEFDKTIKGADIKKCESINDILQLMGE